MSPKIEQYSRGIDECLAKADQSPSKEIHDLWISLAGSYRCLLAYQARKDMRDTSGLEHRCY